MGCPLFLACRHCQERREKSYPRESILSRSVMPGMLLSRRSEGRWFSSCWSLSMPIEH